MFNCIPSQIINTNRIFYSLSQLSKSVSIFLLYIQFFFLFFNLHFCGGSLRVRYVIWSLCLTLHWLLHLFRMYLCCILLTSIISKCMMIPLVISKTTRLASTIRSVDFHAAKYSTVFYKTETHKNVNNGLVHFKFTTTKNSLFLFKY